MKPTLCLLALAVAGMMATPPPAAGQASRRDQSPSAPAQSPNRPANGPWNGDVGVYRLTAGGALERATAFPRAGVPTVARLADGRLLSAFQHFPADDERHFDRVAVRFSADDGRTWTAAEPIVVHGMEEGLARPFDPTLVPLPDGRIRLYFTSNRSPDFRRSLPAIYSALSTNGIHYAFEPGVRFAVEDRVVIDCAVVLHQGKFHLFAPDNGTGDEFMRAPQNQAPPRNGTGYHAISEDGLNFRRVAEVQIPGNRRWLGNAWSDGRQITFIGTGESSARGAGAGRGGLWLATSREGSEWELIDSPPVAGADPGAAMARDGSLVIVATQPSARGSQAAGGPGDGPGPRPLGRGEGPAPRGEPGGRDGFPPGANRTLRVETVNSRYAPAAPARPGVFVTGQAADVVLGAPGFNETGGPLLFNHPTGLATDGKRLLVADRWNNRILVWHTAPATNQPPDLVLGQPDFQQNNPGTGRHQLNWPGNVTVSPTGWLAVTDTENDRILIWQKFPSRSGAPADLVIELAKLPGAEPTGTVPQPGARFHAPLGWPWGVWTDGTKFAVVATRGSAVLIWRQLPSRDHQPPDLVLRPSGAGTPRNITSDGQWFAVSDHNYGERNRPATLVWRSFPTDARQAPDFTWAEWMKGSFTPDHGLVLAGMRAVYHWTRVPADNQTDATAVMYPASYRNGDGPDAVVANGRLYVCNYNGNNVLGWNSLPARNDVPPDFALGSRTPDEDTWADNHFITNPAVATDGKSLFVSSDFDRKLFVWRQLPAESGAKPDLVFHLPTGPWDNAVHSNRLALAGRSTVYLWDRLPLNGEPPDRMLGPQIGGVTFRELTGVAMDSRYFYLADAQANAIYVWEGWPDEHTPPRFSLPMERPGRLSSDGEHLTAAPFEGQSIALWTVAALANRPEPVWLGGRGKFNLPGDALVAQGRLFVADRSHHRVQVWERWEDAVAGQPADAYLGAEHADDRRAAIGRNQLFMPGSLAYDGSRLWVGEFKFSTRILRFSPVEKK